MSELLFSKYQGLGNDFIIIDEMNVSVKSTKEASFSLSLSKRIALCDRHLGVGADGVLTVFATSYPGALAYMHVTNSDGSVPEICGNGFRCVVKWLFDQGKIPNQKSGALLTDAGLKTFSLENNLCTVDMGVANFKQAFPQGELSFEQIKIKATALSLGNPHLVLEMMPDEDGIKKIGAYFENSNLFANRTNVEFVSIINRNQLKVSVWERGVGLTKACGTGACAVVAALVQKGQLAFDEEIQVHLAGGMLFIRAVKESGKKMLKEPLIRIIMRGPADLVFTGIIKE